MQRDLFDDDEIALELIIDRRPEPILSRCLDPAKMRSRAARGRSVPCFRCIAFRPETEAGCFFLSPRVIRSKP